MHGLLLLLFFNVACKKANDRRCFKSTGNKVEIEIPLDSTNHFKLYKNLKYYIVQDSLQKVIIRGGENVVGFVDVVTEDFVTSVRNTNSCNFLRDAEAIIEVEIHYPHPKRFYIEPSDSVIFKNTISCDSLIVDIRDGGGSARLDVNVGFLYINVSHGTADYTLTGNANNAEVKIQNNGFADASAFNAPAIFLYHNSTGDLKINLENSSGLVLINGTGNVLYTGMGLALELQQNGSGKFVKL